MVNGYAYAVLQIPARVTGSASACTRAFTCQSFCSQAHRGRPVIHTIISFKCILGKGCTKIDIK